MIHSIANQPLAGVARFTPKYRIDTGGSLVFNKSFLWTRLKQKISTSGSVSFGSVSVPPKMPVTVNGQVQMRGEVVFKGSAPMAVKQTLNMTGNLTFSGTMSFNKKLIEIQFEG